MANEEQINIEELKLIADVLMGTAHADGVEDSAEFGVVVDIIEDLLLGHEIPESITERISAFDPSSFDVVETCKRLNFNSANDRRTLLALIAEVTDADDIHDLEEDEYIRVVAAAIGSGPEEYSDLTVELEISTLNISPPPIPESALSEGAESAE